MEHRCYFGSYLCFNSRNLFGYSNLKWLHCNSQQSINGEHITYCGNQWYTNSLFGKQFYIYRKRWWNLPVEYRRNCFGNICFYRRYLYSYCYIKWLHCNCKQSFDCKCKSNDCQCRQQSNTMRQQYFHHVG